MNNQIRSAAYRAADERKLTQAKLAKRCGLTQQAVGRVLNGDRKGDPTSWERILEVLDLKLVAVPKDADIEQLFEKEGE